MMRSIRRQAVWMAVILAGLAPAAGAQTTIMPRGPDDWKLFGKEGDVEWSVSVNRRLESGAHPIWEFHLDAPLGKHGQVLQLRLELADFGIPPQPLEDAEHWMWGWYVRNRETADNVCLLLINEEGTPIRLATTPGVHDHQRDYFRPPDRYTETWNTLTEAFAANLEIEETPHPGPGRIVAIAITFELPHRQEVWLGPITFSPPKPVPEPPADRARPDVRAAGRMLPVDLDGDGALEVLTPWAEGRKLWRFDRKAGEYRLDRRIDGLVLAGPLRLAVAADLDADGDQDLVALGSDLETLHVLHNRAWGFAGSVLRVPLPQRGAKAYGMTVADDDGDGRPDLLIGYHLMTGEKRGRIFRLPGLDGGGFGPPQNLPETAKSGHNGTFFISLVDLDDDGVLDLVSATTSPGIFVFPGLGEGRYGDGVLIAPLVQSGFFRDIAFADVDGDGRIDLYISMLDMSQLPTRTGRNRLLRNEGGFRFREVAVSTGLAGGSQTGDACFADVDGRPGLELVVLEKDRVDAYDLATWRAAGAGDSTRVERIPLLSDLHIVSGAEMIALTDVDDDGRADLVLSREEGISAYPLTGSGPVRRVGVSYRGVRAGAVGATLAGSGWRIPVESNNRTAPGAWIVAASDSITVQGAGFRPVACEPGPPGSARVVRLVPQSIPEGAAGTFVAWLRWSAPRLWEYPFLAARQRAVQAGLGFGTIGVLAFLLARARRNARRRLEEDAWLKLLRLVGITSHAKWREAFTNYSRILRHVTAPGSRTGEDGPVRLRALLPPEILATVREGAETAAFLEVEGGRAAARAVRDLEMVHEGKAEWARAVPAAGMLDSALALIQRELAGRFSADAEGVYRRVVAFRARDAENAPDFVWSPEDPALVAAFPMRADHLFACLDELVANALKKSPGPRRVTVRTGREGQHRAFLSVHDDGAPLEQERDRAERDGSRTGIARIEQILVPYAGRVALESAPDGGVIATLRVPRFDLDA